MVICYSKYFSQNSLDFNANGTIVFYTNELWGFGPQIHSMLGGIQYCMLQKNVIHGYQSLIQNSLIHIIVLIIIYHISCILNIVLAIKKIFISFHNTTLYIYRALCLHSNVKILYTYIVSMLIPNQILHLIVLYIVIYI